MYIPKKGTTKTVSMNTKICLHPVMFLYTSKYVYHVLLFVFALFILLVLCLYAVLLPTVLMY